MRNEPDSNDGPGVFNRFTSPGAVPGSVAGRPGGDALLHLMCYDHDNLIERKAETLSELEGFIDHSKVNWINVEGVGDAEVLLELGERFGIHVLALEDVTNSHQRSKVEEYDDELFIVVRMIYGIHRDVTGGIDCSFEQLAVYLGDHFVITFQDGRPGDCLEPLRDRIRGKKGRIRSVNSGGLAYAILDSVIDHYFPMVESIASALDEIDDAMIEGTATWELTALRDIRKQVLHLRRILRPHAETMLHLMRSETTLITEDTRLFLRDCHDHVKQLLDALETCRETCSELRDAHLTAISTRQDEVMKTLTIIATLFMPMGFVAGLYGMNFENMPELHWSFGYPLALAMMATIAGSLLVWFYRRGWFR